jgi:hypothetical protein
MYYPLTICGAFFTKEYIDYLKNDIAFVKEDIEIVTFIKQFLETETDLSQYPDYMKEIVMVYKDDFLYEENKEDGYYIGIPLFDIPDHFSMKRICIDINNLMRAAKILDDNAPLNAITIFSKILVVTDEDLKNLGISN